MKRIKLIHWNEAEGAACAEKIRAAALASGLVDYKVCSVDRTWTGLRFARKKKR